MRSFPRFKILVLLFVIVTYVRDNDSRYHTPDNYSLDYTIDWGEKMYAETCMEKCLETVGYIGGYVLLESTRSERSYTD